MLSYVNRTIAVDLCLGLGVGLVSDKYTETTTTHTQGHQLQKPLDNLTDCMTFVRTTTCQQASQSCHVKEVVFVKVIQSDN